MPNIPNGTDTRNTSRQATGASTPPSTRPMNEPRDRGDHVDPERKAALIGAEGVGQDGRRVGHQKRRADPLHDAHDDHPQRAGAARAAR